jgi:hypothetical protein
MLCIRAVLSHSRALYPISVFIVITLRRSGIGGSYRIKQKTAAKYFFAFSPFCALSLKITSVSQRLL